MKKIVALLFTALAIAALQLNVFAAAVSALPTKRLSEEFTDNVSRLTKSVTLKTDLVIEADEFLIIPKGKRLTLSADKSITVKGGLFVEKGGKLNIDKGEIKIEENAALLSRGTVNISGGGTIKAAQNASMLVAPSGSLNLKGDILLDISASDFVCLGEYSGAREDIAAEIISAVTYRENMYTGECDNFAVYSKSKAKKLFPDDFSLSDTQAAAAGGRPNYINFFCSNGEVISIIVYGDLDGGDGMIFNMQLDMV